MIEYKFERVESYGYVIKEAGHTMFPEDVIRRFDRLNYLEQQKVKLEEDIAILTEEIQNGCNRCTDDCSQSPMAPEYTKLQSDKAALIEALERWNKSFANTLSKQEYQVEIFNLLNERYIEANNLLEKLK